MRVVKMKTAAILLALSCCMVGPVLAETLEFNNHRNSTVWIGARSIYDNEDPYNGGFAIDAGGQVTVMVMATKATAGQWAGIFWARTGCTFDDSGNGHCETGDCGNKLECNGAGGTPPFTLARFHFNSSEGDAYEVSLEYGYNVGMQVRPRNLDVTDEYYICNTAGCLLNLTDDCPEELRQKDSSGALVACRSACTAFNTDQYCCRGNYSAPDTCMADEWPFDYAAIFKDYCPQAYSYFFDNQDSTFICRDSGYVITIS